jgi:1,5-anhydro-D-fructose reductase (1,5-anhydro-D-mannitol-forming)
VLNWAIVGVGDIARKRVLAALAGASRSRIRVAVTTHPDRARQICAPYGVERYCTELGEALADHEVDAVYIATPVFLHAPQSISAMVAGKHVLCEKPTAMNYEEAARMVQVAEARGVVFGVSFYRRYYPKILRLQELIRDGGLGRVTLARAGCHTWLGADDLPGRTWLVEQHKSGGGPLPDVGSHRIDVLNFLFGTPVSVAAEMGTQIQDYAVEDSAALLMQYASGMRSVLDVRWNSRIERDELSVIGTEGEADLTPLNGPTLAVRQSGKSWSEELPAHPNLHFPLVEDFVRAVLDGRRLVSTGRTAIETDRVIAAALRSAQSGTRQRI